VRDCYYGAKDGLFEQLDVDVCIDEVNGVEIINKKKMS